MSKEINTLVYENDFEYRHLKGSSEYSIEDAVWYGKLLGIPHLCTYEAKTLEGLREAFKGTVDCLLDEFSPMVGCRYEN